MLWPGSPSNAVVSIELDSSTSLLLVDDLETIIVDEHVGGSSLEFVGGDGLFDGLDGWRNDGAQTLLIHRALDRDVRQSC